MTLPRASPAADSAATPRIALLAHALLEQILAEAFALLETPGVKVHSAEALSLLGDAGARVDRQAQLARIPEPIARKALESVPRRFHLHDREGRAVVEYGGDAVHFVPGSAAVHVLDPDTNEHRDACTGDLVRLVKVVDVLPEFDAQSTALVCADVPAAVADLYRLYLVLLLSAKPVVTGAFGLETLHVMREMLTVVGGDGSDGRARAIFDVCPSPPLTWSAFGAENLIILARARLPVEIVSMPLAGATAPVTLAGTVVQHAAECLSGITLHQLAGPGAPIVWGGAPAIFDMRHGTTPYGAIETAMIDAAYAQVGRHLGLPTHTYLCASDAKTLDAQAGLESGMTALVGALAGINMISGAGMLDFLACQSVEKLVLDAEAIGMVRRLLAGVAGHAEPLALDVFAETGHAVSFLGLKHTRQWFRQEQRLPSALIDRASVRAWSEAGRPDARTRARARAVELLGRYQPNPPDAAQVRELRHITERAAQAAGMERLPSLD